MPKRSLVNDLLEVYRVTNLRLSNREKWLKLSTNGQNMATALASEHQNKSMYRDIRDEIRENEGKRVLSISRLTSLLAGQKISLEVLYRNLSTKWKQLLY